MKNSSIAGCLYGMAIGDALAAPVEFLRTPEIESYFARYGFGGGNKALTVTDDTQMALAVGEALMATPRPYTAAGVEPPLRRAFVAWMNSPENNRAPGMTCMSACRRLGEGLPWEQSTVVHSKGCGANMRVQPVGLLFGETAETRAALAQFQAAVTHGHPTGLAASDLTAWTIHDLATGGDPATLPARLIQYARSQRTKYHFDWLGDIWKGGGGLSATGFIVTGWDECLQSLAQLQTAVERGDRESDPCDATGEGWIAEEAFATGLLSFLLFVDDPVAALRRASVTRGDSDSIACFTGAFCGAYHGIDAFPTEWRERVEYRDRLDALTTFLAELAK
ncbi:MAG: ADP-ribosylglycohydrolase family protein [Fibrella sp.]|nr:ADP-ribosylglycohydrolase family protein [Armatimonadota bacterium]